MIVGIGNDIVEISRIKKAIERNPNFIKRILTQAEYDYCVGKRIRYESIAARFAGKEALAKALGTGFRAFSFLDIEILRDELGKPEIILKNKAKDLVEENDRIHVSLSHSKEYANAIVIIEKE